MDYLEYEILRRLSSSLFKNGLLFPVAVVLLRKTAIDASFSARDVREGLGGRAESNQISEIVERIGEIGAVTALPYPGRPHPRLWIRPAHPFWGFVEAWSKEALAAVPSGP